MAEPIDSKPHDFFLTLLVKMCELGGLSVPITLTVGGSVISGEIISTRAYFDGFTAAFVGGIEEGNPVREVIRTHMEPLKGVAPEPERFIHLRNAQWFKPGSPPMPERRDSLWRGRVSAVDGFTLGTLKVD